MKKIVFITTGDAEYGFKLTGLDHYVIEEQKVEETLRKIIGEPDVGLVIIDERLIKGINEETLKRIERTWYGIFIVLPSPEMKL
jgi:V/A-type H+-transporting ATPase subunit F